MRRLSQKQETFCVKYFELGNATEAARIARYSPKTAAVIANENLKKPNIMARISELREKVQDSAIMNVSERQEQLTEVARADLNDTAIRAIDILNKMDKIYTEGTQVNINNVGLAIAYRNALTEAEAEYKQLDPETKEVVE